MKKNQNQNLSGRIKNQTDLSQRLEILKVIDPSLAEIIDGLPEVPLRLRAPGFEGLAEIITAQQVSKASANAIFGRLSLLIAPLTAENFLKRGEAPLIEAGLSRAKQSTMIGLAEAVLVGDLDIEKLCEVSIDEALEKLTSLKGIGPWTAEVFLLFCAGHEDVFPAGDVALQHAVGAVLQLPKKPDILQTRELARRWAPMRGVAARVLYAYYAQMKNSSEISA